MSAYGCYRVKRVRVCTCSNDGALENPSFQDAQITARATQPMYLNCDLRTFDLSTLGSKFDVILIDPPLEEYQRRASGINFTWTPWEWEEVYNYMYVCMFTACLYKSIVLFGHFLALQIIGAKRRH